MKINESRAVITGAAGGLGQALSEALLKAGAAVMLVGRSERKLDELSRQLQRITGVDASRIATQVADLTRADHLNVLSVLAAAWGCNVLIHNAGLPAFGRLQDESSDRIEDVVQTNLIAPMLLTRSMLPHLLTTPRAHVVCIGSALGAIGLPGYAVYGASKFGLRGFSQALRRELLETSVRVQYFGPRATRTSFNSEAAAAYQRATGSASDLPEQVALELLQLLESEAAERFLGYPEKIATRLNGLAPSMLDGSFKRHSRYLTNPESTRPVLS